MSLLHKDVLQSYGPAASLNMNPARVHATLGRIKGVGYSGAIKLPYCQAQFQLVVGSLVQFELRLAL